MFFKTVFDSKVIDKINSSRSKNIKMIFNIFRFDTSNFNASESISEIHKQNYHHKCPNLSQVLSRNYFQSSYPLIKRRLIKHSHQLRIITFVKEYQSTFTYEIQIFSNLTVPFNKKGLHVSQN